MSQGAVLRKVPARRLTHPTHALATESIENRSALSFELAARRGQSLYRASRQPGPASDVVVFPSLLAPFNDQALSREELIDETRLLLERRQQKPLPDDTYIYSLRVMVPAPFRATEHLLDLLRAFDASAASGVKAGYVTHEVLYGLLPDEGRLSALLTAFLADATVVEVKVRRQPEEQRVVRVTLAD